MAAYMGKDDQPSAPFEADPESGAIRNTELDTRVMPLSAFGWAALKIELDSTFMSGAQVIFQRMGYSYGRYLARVAKQKAGKSKKGLTANSIFDILLEGSTNHGWGKLTLGSGDFEKGVATLVLKDCFFCLHDKKGPVATCNFFVGLVGGVADEAVGQSHRTSEGRCVAKDDALCEFRLERVAPTGGA